MSRLVNAFVLLTAVLVAFVMGSCKPSPPTCRADAGCFGACPSPTALCDERSGQWVGCLTDDDCEGATPVCSPTARECIACATNADCSHSANGAVCDVGTGQCERCVANSDCRGDMPACSPETHECVGCSNNEDCAQSTRGHACDVEAGTCHTCVSNADCGGSTPVCSSIRACVGCTTGSDCATATLGQICDPAVQTCRECRSHADCAGIPGATSCNVATGACVQCTPDTEASICGGYSCSRSSSRCTGRPLRSVPPCIPCEADSECASGYCVDRSRDQSSFGQFCLPPISSGCPAPYPQPREGPSTDQPRAQYCSPRPQVSCEAIFHANRACTGRPGEAISDGSCGHPVSGDGICFSHSVLPPSCSYACHPSGPPECVPGMSCVRGAHGGYYCSR